MSSKNWNRRELLKTLGSAAVGIGVVHPVIGESSSNPELFNNPKFKKPERHFNSLNSRKLPVIVFYKSAGTQQISLPKFQSVWLDMVQEDRIIRYLTPCLAGVL